MMQRDASSVLLHLNHHLHYHHLLQQQQQRASSAFVSVRPRHALAIPSSSSSPPVAPSINGGDHSMAVRGNEPLKQQLSRGGGQVRREGSGRFRDFRVETILGGGNGDEEEEVVEEEPKEQGAGGAGPTADKDGCEFAWIHCTRYKPPRLPKVRRRADGANRHTGRSPRVPFSSAQVAALEWRFREAHYLSGADVAELSASLYLSHNRVKIWFQNRRARERRARRLAAEKGGDPCPLHAGMGTVGQTRSGPVPPPPAQPSSSSSSSPSPSTLSFLPRYALYLQSAEFFPLLGSSVQQQQLTRPPLVPMPPRAMAVPCAHGPGAAGHV
ncbi:unnamed protein product [Lampetra planeri]